MAKYERTIFEIDNGICIKCHKEMAAKGRLSCPNCLEKFKLVYRKRKAKQQLWYQENNEAIKEKSKNRYHFRREHGLCTRCGKKAEEGKSKCARCRIRDKVNRLKRNDA